VSDLLNPNIQKAVAFFTQAGLSRLLVKLREKYIKVGHIGGQIALEHALPDERRNIPLPALRLNLSKLKKPSCIVFTAHCLSC
jgi:hypothetical protein